MTDYDVEIIRYCAEVNGPCWECSMRDQCQYWGKEEEEWP